MDYNKSGRFLQFVNYNDLQIFNPTIIRETICVWKLNKTRKYNTRFLFCSHLKRVRKRLLRIYYNCSTIFKSKNSFSRKQSFYLQVNLAAFKVKVVNCDTDTPHHFFMKMQTIYTAVVNWRLINFIDNKHEIWKPHDNYDIWLPFRISKWEKKNNAE